MNIKYIIRRIGIAILTWFIALFFSYLLFMISPLKPINYILSQMGISASPTGAGASGNPSLGVVSQVQYQVMMEWSRAFEITGNPVTGFLIYLKNIFTGNWGWSFLLGLPVLQLIAAYLPWTLFIITIVNILNYIVGVWLGQYMAYHRGSKSDVALIQFITIKRAIPIYIYTVLFVFFFAYQYNIFPISGAYSPNVSPGFNLPFIASVLYHAALPILILFIAGLGHWALAMRGNIISQLGEDYVMYAEARGLPSKWIRSRYVGRNALLPIYTSLIIALGFSFGGSVFVETLTSYPGVGMLLTSALSNGDWALGMGILLVLILAVVLGMAIADFTYSLIDPRVRVEK